MPKARAPIDFDSNEDRLRHVTPKVVRAVSDRIIEKIHPEKIVLWGSHTKGVAMKDSDLDLIEKTWRFKNLSWKKLKN